MEAALTKGTRKETLELAIPSDLDAASVVSVHAELVALLAEASETNAVAQVDLAKSDSVSPLSLQLLASAANSFPRKSGAFRRNRGRGTDYSRDRQGDLKCRKLFSASMISKSIRDMIGFTLEPRGYTVIGAGDGKEGLAAAGQHQGQPRRLRPQHAEHERHRDGARRARRRPLRRHPDRDADHRGAEGEDAGGQAGRRHRLARQAFRRRQAGLGHQRS